MNLLKEQLKVEKVLIFMEKPNFSLHTSSEGSDVCGEEKRESKLLENQFCLFLKQFIYVGFRFEKSENFLKNFGFNSETVKENAKKSLVLSIRI